SRWPGWPGWSSRSRTWTGPSGSAPTSASPWPTGRRRRCCCAAGGHPPRAWWSAAAPREDLDRLARGTGGTVTAHHGGHAVVLRDPSGYPVRVVHGVPDLAPL